MQRRSHNKDAVPFVILTVYITVSSVTRCPLNPEAYATARAVPVLSLNCLSNMVSWNAVGHLQTTWKRVPTLTGLLSIYDRAELPLLHLPLFSSRLVTSIRLPLMHSSCQMVKHRVWLPYHVFSRFLVVTVLMIADSSLDYLDAQASNYLPGFLVSHNHIGSSLAP